MASPLNPYKLRQRCLCDARGGRCVGNAGMTWKAKELMPLTTLSSLLRCTRGPAALGRLGACLAVEAADSRLGSTCGFTDLHEACCMWGESLWTCRGGRALVSCLATWSGGSSSCPTRRMCCRKPEISSPWPLLKTKIKRMAANAVPCHSHSQVLNPGSVYL